MPRKKPNQNNWRTGLRWDKKSKSWRSLRSGRLLTTRGLSNRKAMSRNATLAGWLRKLSTAAKTAPRLPSGRFRLKPKPKQATREITGRKRQRRGPPKITKTEIIDVRFDYQETARGDDRITTALDVISAQGEIERIHGLVQKHDDPGAIGGASKGFTYSFLIGLVDQKTQRLKLDPEWRGTVWKRWKQSVMVARGFLEQLALTDSVDVFIMAITVSIGPSDFVKL